MISVTVLMHPYLLSNGANSIIVSNSTQSIPTKNGRWVIYTPKGVLTLGLIALHHT